MKRKPFISVIIPTYNRADLVLKCLSYVNQQTLKPIEIIIVDNGSTDKTRSLAKKYFPKVIIHRLLKNYGFARACNEGIRRSKGNLVAILNNDAFPKPNWLLNIYKTFLSHPNFSAFTPKMVSYANTKIIESVGDMVGSNMQIIHRGTEELDKKQYNRTEEVFLVPAAASVYTRGFFKHIGLFDEIFVSYFEDVDLSFRGQLFGHKYLYVPNSVVAHMGKETSKVLDSRGFWELRNSMLVWIKNLPTSLIRRDKLLIKLISFYIKLNFSDFRFGKVLLFAKVMFNITANLPMLMSSRKKIQSRKAVTDEYIYLNFSKANHESE